MAMSGGCGRAVIVVRTKAVVRMEKRADVLEQKVNLDARHLKTSASAPF